MLWAPYLLSILVGAVAGSEVAQIIPGAFIVEYEDASQGSSALNDVGATKTLDLNYELFQGAAIRFEDKKPVGERIAQLLEQPAIKNVWPNRLIPRPDARINAVASRTPAGSAFDQVARRSQDNDTLSTHVQTQVDKLRAEGIIGEGVKIAVIDTGIDYTHPALGGCFGPHCLVVGGYDLVGDDYNGDNTPVPDDDPSDQCSGHGTHVAGIIAARPNELGFTGAAPGVKLAAYRIFGCRGLATTEVMIAAFLRAQQDDANIITASFGYYNGWSNEALNAVTTRIVAKGVIITASAGNDGANGLFYAFNPASGNGVASIASFDNTVTPVVLSRASYSVSGDAKQSFDFSIGLPRDWTGVKFPLWTPSFNTSEADQGCNPFPSTTPDLSEKVVLIRRGTCFFDDKVQNAVAHGAKYIVFYNNVPGYRFLVLENYNLTATGMVSSTQGATWVRDLAAGKVVTLDIPNVNRLPVTPFHSSNNITGGFVSALSNWGPTWEAGVKPTFGTPGGDILSTYPVALGSYTIISGTSMAAPLAAAIYALLSNVRKTFDPQELQNVLAATAKPVQANNDGDISPWLAPIAQQGAGLLQAYDAAYATTVLSDSSLAFNDTVRLTDKNFTISNTGQEAITYELDVIGAATAYTFSNSTTPDPYPGLELDGSFATVHLSEYKVTVPAGGKSTISVHVIPPSRAPARLPVYGGYIRLNGTNGESLSLPYQGIAGDLNAHTVLNTTTYVSSSLNDPDYALVLGDNLNFLFPQINITDIANITDALPVAAIKPVFGSPRINIEILSTSNHTTNLGHAIGSPNEWTTRKLYPWTWNGQLNDGSFVPPGSYKFRISALHLFGDVNDTKQYDVSESPSFTIKYKGINNGTNLN
ncbi:hypothetical protein COCMIDRAFT_104952 [Bipolaris oryzae ATCC 44560]|uniref:Peptidase S8/S53 domain-containing protein n=1 Tax=Bipolaris oryzae ATCC 44560 TaxID=930090 RepID=W6YWJ2_COCMI|nr:uncharacterized protein COCMIDRAFT_104952 [Bipolaris oryzae ATCC 44560]EUC41893.1 hypothetical protein COCMIDRAFT_104952 [Bipolaris oryzae ATCC 44560]